MRTTTLLHISIALLTILITFATCIPIFTRATRYSQNDITPIYIHNFLEDYETYLSAITRGQHGSFFMDPFNIPNRTTRSIYSLYSIAGMITGPFHIWPPFVYHALRILLIACLVYTIYAVFHAVLENDFWASAGTLISLTVTIPPQFLFNSKVASTFQSWWQYLSPVNRFDNLPHHLAAQVLLLLSIAFLFHFIKIRSPANAAISSCCCALGVLMVPHVVVVYLILLWTHAGLQIYHLFQKYNLRRIYEQIAYGTLMSILPVIALYIIWTGTNDAVWIANRTWEVNYWRQDPYIYYHYYLAHLYFLIPASIGFIHSIRKKERSTPTLLAVWIMIPLIMAPFIERVGSGTGRFITQTYIYIPLIIFTTYAFQLLIKSHIGKKLSIICIALLPILGTYDIVQRTINKRDQTRLEPVNTKYYPLRSYYELVSWIKNNIPKDTVMVAGPELGSLIVTQAPVFMYIGDETHGANWDLNMDKIQNFYSGKMDPETAKAWLTGMNSQYVIQDVNMAWQPETPPPYPFLKKIWSNNISGVYQIVL